MSTATEQKKNELEETVETLEPGAQEHVVTVGKDDQALSFVQRPLSFFGKMDLFAVLGGVMNRAMSGPDGVTLGEIIDSMPSGDVKDIRDADVFARGAARLAMMAPDAIGDLICVLLAVPRGQREYVKEVMGLPEGQGGLSDEEGMGILRRGVDQNWEVLVAFFTHQVADLAKGISDRVQPEKPKKKRGGKSQS